MRKYNIQDIYASYGMTTEPKNAWGFLLRHEGILHLSAAEQAKELYQKWSQENFQTLLALLFAQSKGRGHISIAASEAHPPLTKVQQILREDIMMNHSLEALFHKFIRPKAIQAEGVDYGYSELECSRYANLSASGTEAYEKICLFLESNKILKIDNSQTPERLRRERKTAFDALFTALTKHPGLTQDAEMQRLIFSAFDAGLKSERITEIMNMAVCIMFFTAWSTVMMR